MLKNINKNLMFCGCVTLMVASGMGFNGSTVSAADIVNMAEETVVDVPQYSEPEVITEVWETLKIPNRRTAFKSQESFRALKKPSTKQYKMQHDGKAWTDQDGFRRYGDEGYYMVAMGSYYSKGCGTVLRITLDTGKSFTAITGDQKADRHTDWLNQYCVSDGSVVEFIVDLNKISPKARRMGDMSYAAKTDMRGNIVKIERLV